MGNRDVWRGARVLMVIDMPASLAGELFPDELLSSASPSYAREALERDLADLPERLAGSMLAAAARSLAYELENPYVSATAKSMCAKSLAEVIRELRLLAPPKMEEDEIERARKRRAKRLEGTPAAGTAPSS